MKTAAWVTILLGALTYSCSSTHGTETQNPGIPLRSFKDSGCKKDNAKFNSSDGGISTATQALVATDYGTETRGLKCVAWEAIGDEQLKIDFYNFDGSCGAKWSGDASVADDGSLELGLANPGCAIASCGTCMYDWSFELGGVNVLKDVTVALSIDTCPGQKPAAIPIRSVSLTLPTAARPTGIVCNYGDFGGLGWQAMALGECGTEAMPCSGTSMCSANPGATDPTCQADLICTDNGNADQRICARSCAADADCGALGILSCQAGLCRPANPW